LYERIEKQLLEFSAHVPLTKENEELPFPRLITWIMDSCGLIDSVFRELSPDELTFTDKVGNERRKPKKDFNIYDYARLHAGQLDLPNTRSLLLVSPPRLYSPFAAWRNVTDRDPYPELNWWANYNSLKYDRLQNINLGTLGTALNSICALHQVLARINKPERLLMLLRRRWIVPGDYDPSSLIGYIKEKSRLPPGPSFMVRTELFAVPVGGEEQLPEDISDIESFRFHAGPDLAIFFASLGMLKP
jgi:hypothetical protein